MDNGIYAVFPQNLDHKFTVAGGADDKRDIRWYRRAYPCRHIIEHNDALSDVAEVMDHVAADIAGASCDENCHRIFIPYNAAIAACLLTTASSIEKCFWS